MYQLAYAKAKEINTISSYNTFIIAYSTAKEVKRANKNAYKLELEKYTDLGMMSFVGSEGKLEKKAIKLLTKAKQMEKTSKEKRNGFKIGYLIIANRMHGLLQDKFGDTDAALRYLESQEFLDFSKSFKKMMTGITKTINRIEKSEFDLEIHTVKIMDISRKGFADSKSDREMKAYHQKKSTQWDKLMRYRNKGYN